MTIEDGQGYDRVIIRSYPKIIFLYPSLLAAVAAGVWTWLSLRSVSGDLSQVSLGPGRLFFIVFAFNMLVLAADFSRRGFVAALLSVLLLVTGGALIEAKLPIFSALESFFALFRLRADPHFYLALAFTLALLMGFVLIATRFDFWEVRSNEILHYTGFMAEVERFPAPGLRFKKVVPDVFEYALLLSGKIVLIPANGEAQEIVHIPRVDAVEAKLDSLLGSISVNVRYDPNKAGPNPGPPPPL